MLTPGEHFRHVPCALLAVICCQKVSTGHLAQGSLLVLLASPFTAGEEGCSLLWDCPFAASCFQCELRQTTYSLSTLISHLRNGNEAVSSFLHLDSEISSPLDVLDKARVKRLSSSRASKWLLSAGLSSAWG